MDHESSMENRVDFGRLENKNIFLVLEPIHCGSTPTINSASLFSDKKEAEEALIYWFKQARPYHDADLTYRVEWGTTLEPNRVNVVACKDGDLYTNGSYGRCRFATKRLNRLYADYQ